MSIRSLTVSMVCGLSALAFGCSATTGSVVRNDGRLDVTVDVGEGVAPVDGSLTIVGMDRQHRTRVDVSSIAATGGLELSLPAGLYSVHWTPDGGFDGAELFDPSSARVVVVGAGGVSTVALRARPVDVFAAHFDAVMSEAAPLAMR